MGKLHGTIVDATNGSPLEAKVHILDSTGSFRAPPEALLKRGPGQPFFFCGGEFTVDVTIGQADILVERGTEYRPLLRTLHMPNIGTVDAELPLERWTDLPSVGWYPGNTHIHYDEKESHPDERLRVDTRVEEYNVTVVSILQRRDLPYASNKYPVGLMTDYCTAHHVLDIGEECRHNREPWRIGYGHVMFLRLRNVVGPVSRGVLVSDFAPDYPPLCFACDDARGQEGIVLWCHNGNGMEAPVAAALGKLDGFNLFDPYWMDPEYDIWYKLLNCGLMLPGSSGTDWFVCSNNRVYVQTEGGFSYDAWLEGLKKGRTFITNGPALFLAADGRGPGSTLDLSGRQQRPLEAHVSWRSHYPLNLIEMVQDGAVVQRKEYPEGTAEGQWEVALATEKDGWVAARCSGRARDSFGHAVYAHTSPIYLRGGAPNEATRGSAGYFLRSIDESLDWVRRKGRFTEDRQRGDVVDLFLSARKVYERLATP